MMARRLRHGGLAAVIVAVASLGLVAGWRGAPLRDAPATLVVVGCLACHDGLLGVLARP